MLDRPTPEAAEPLLMLRALCMALPEATERVSHGEPAWFVRKSPQFVMFADHHHDDRIGFVAAAPAGAQQDWIARDGSRFYDPPYVGGRGWIGVYLDVEQDWEQIADIVEDAYRTVAPRTLITQLDAERQPE
ncbi:MmcQ/YjbR family DNA-binding protein [Rhodococcus sp. 1168]|uniref:MmcQ/YjbR family DNA-binding protein n=1 Tax=Rhodococcus sp. 1168 TaxID=2018041 RepID=UPI000A0C9153|nr:MmcQ/YjbR family DNA-binding protein [Rhodococcus sp. 1168]ORI26101.1 phosphoribosylglycinamide formyltransferase [Rhodococcus sp. 1168]